MQSPGEGADTCVSKLLSASPGETIDGEEEMKRKKEERKENKTEGKENKQEVLLEAPLTCNFVL